MNRFTMPLVLVALTCALIVVPTRGEDPPKKLTAEERKELEAKWKEQITDANKAYDARQYAEGQKALEAALEIARRLYPKSEYPEGHANLATTMDSLGNRLALVGKFSTADPLLRDALDMRRRLLKGDH